MKDNYEDKENPGILYEGRLVVSDHASGEVIIYGKDHSGQIPIRGKNAVETIVNPLGWKDELKRVGSVGWKTWLGALTVYPERLAKVTAKFKW